VEGCMLFRECYMLFIPQRLKYPEYMIDYRQKQQKANAKTN